MIAEQELVLTQAMLREAGLHGRVQVVIGAGEMPIFPGATTDAECLVQDRADCLGYESAPAYDFHVKLDGRSGAR